MILAGGLCGLLADAQRGKAGVIRRAHGLHKALDRGHAGKGHDICRARLQHGAQRVRLSAAVCGVIQRHVGDGHARGFQLLGQDLPACRRAQQQRRAALRQGFEQRVREVFPVVLRGDEVGRKAVTRQRVRSTAADRRKTHTVQRAQVAPEPVQRMHRRVHARRAGEHRPVVALRKRVRERLHVFPLCRLDARCFDHLRAQRAQARRQRARPLARPGHDDRFAVQRQGREPVQPAAQRAHPPHNDERRAFQPRCAHLRREVGHGRDHLALRAARAVFDHGRGHVGRDVRREQAVHDLLERGQAHEEHQRAVQPHQTVKIDVQRLARAGVRGDDVHGRAEIAVRDRDARERGRGQRARHARDDRKRHIVFQQVFALLAAAAEQVAVAALEPHDLLARLRQPHEDLVDLILRHGVMVVFLADVDALGPLRDQAEDVLIHQPVVYDRVRAGDGLRACDGQQAAAAGSRADQRYLSCHSSPSACLLSCKASVRPSEAASRRAPVTAPRADRVSSSETYSPRRWSTSPSVSA